MTRPDETPGPDEIAARLAKVRARDNAGTTAGADGPQGRGQAGSGLGIGMRISIELVTTVAVGGALGYGLDVWWGSAPAAMVVCLLFGGAAGVSNAYRVVKGLDDSVGLGGAIARKETKEGNKSRGQSG
ncbi:AtpZ/AtpI family protein [Pararhodospirillum oryzae]|uniref:ATP synthase protein I n=1 Tax=Pararhodospirillum oryzae TaxID=478448 RepID=A0A512H5E6_9PROT|nr:AtpZ/AtpI family protein [Pararhodospirillum oryzae]GEO80692.1 ATP synthase protein I [Pararhodospirillum oryzae]